MTENDLFSVLVEDEEDITRQVRKQGPGLKEWDQLGPQQKRKKSQVLFNELKRTSETRVVHPVRMVGSLLHR